MMPMLKEYDILKYRNIVLVILSFLILILLVTGIIFSLEFWKITAPVLIAVIIWYLNEISKRVEQQYQLKANTYSKILESLEGFYEGGSIDQKKLLISEYRKLWLVSPDYVIENMNSFFDTVHASKQSSDNKKEEALGNLVTSLRTDLISNRRVTSTKLDAKDLKHIKAS